MVVVGDGAVEVALGFVRAAAVNVGGGILLVRAAAPVVVGDGAVRSPLAWCATPRLL